MEYLVAKCVNRVELKRANPFAGDLARVKGKPTAIKGRVVEGIAAVFGNVDAVGDIVMPGAFRQAIEDCRSNRSRARFLWTHKSSEPPTAVILELKELKWDQLPMSMKFDPSITGGLYVKREYFDDGSLANRVFQGVKAGAITEMSFGYDVLDSDHIEQDGKKIRRLKSLALYDISDVNFGANAATLAVMKHKPGTYTSMFMQRAANEIAQLESSLRPQWLDRQRSEMARLFR